MLKLERTKGEQIVIGDEAIILTLLSVGHDPEKGRNFLLFEVRDNTGSGNGSTRRVRLNVKNHLFVCKNVKVIAVEVGKNKGSFGFEAPPSISIHRREVFEEIRREQTEREQLVTAVPKLRLVTDPEAAPLPMRSRKWPRWRWFNNLFRTRQASSA